MEGLMVLAAGTSQRHRSTDPSPGSEQHWGHYLCFSLEMWKGQQGVRVHEIAQLLIPTWNGLSKIYTFIDVRERERHQ